MLRKDIAVKLKYFRGVILALGQFRSNGNASDAVIRKCFPVSGCVAIVELRRKALLDWPVDQAARL